MPSTTARGTGLAGQHPRASVRHGLHAPFGPGAGLSAWTGQTTGPHIDPGGGDHDDLRDALDLFHPRQYPRAAGARWNGYFLPGFHHWHHTNDEHRDRNFAFVFPSSTGFSAPPGCRNTGPPSTASMPRCRRPSPGSSSSRSRRPPNGQPKIRGSPLRPGAGPVSQGKHGQDLMRAMEGQAAIDAAEPRGLERAAPSAAPAVGSKRLRPPCVAACGWLGC